MRHLRAWQLRGELTNDGEIQLLGQKDVEQGAHHQRQQLGRAEPLHDVWREPQNRDSDDRQSQLRTVNLAEQFRDSNDGPFHPSLGFLAQKGGQLQDHQDGPDPRHEARDHRVGHLGDVTPQAKDPKEDLE